MTTASPPRTDPTTADIGARLTFDRSAPGRTGVILPALDVPEAKPLPDRFLRRDLNLPEMSQNEVIRYFVGLSRLNYSIDTGFYPLGSCTMKYNPKVNEDVARLPGFATCTRTSRPKPCRARSQSFTSSSRPSPRSPAWTP